jgi:hypothetical protein
MNKRRAFIFGIIATALSLILSHQVWSQQEITPIEVTPAADPTQSVRIVVMSDLNSQYGSTEYEPEVKDAIALIPSLNPNLVLAGGDMIAGQKRSLSDDQVNAMWSAFDQEIAQPLRNAEIPFGFTIGNHDGSGALSQEGELIFGRDRAFASRYWNNPNHNPGLNFVDKAHFPFYYTFTQNDIFYLVWDASTAKITPEQLAWVETSLASPTAQNTKLRLAIGHLPLYAVAVGRDKPGEVLNSPETLRTLLEKYNVHTYISGHHHAYYPGRRGELELLHAGALGGGARQLLNSDLTPRKTLTILDLDLDQQAITYTTYDLQTMDIVDQNSLPRIIVSQQGWVMRRDLTPADLTPTEVDQLR